MRLFVLFCIAILFSNPSYSQEQVTSNKVAAISLDMQLASQLNTLEFVGSGGVYSTGKAKPREINLVGFVVDGTEVGVMQVISDSEIGYYYPLVQLLEYLNVKGRMVGGGVDITTPIGQVYINDRELVFHGGKAFITDRALVNQLKLDVEFNESSYSIEVVLPWWEKNSDGSTKQEYDSKDIDYSPSNWNLRQLQARYVYDTDDTFEDDSAEYTIAGGAYGGGWVFRASDDLEGDVTPEEYFWVKQFSNQQLLLGKTNTGVHPLVPNIELSGGSYIYSSEKFKDSGSSDISRSDFARQSGSAVRDIIGQATPGDIAELVINGRSESRSRVRLDGSYEFLDVELPSRGYNDVQVRLFDRSSLTLKATDDYSVSSESIIETVGEFTLYASGGKRGNILDDKETDNPEAGLISFRYGLMDDLTIEAGYQDGGNGIDYKLVGLNASFAKHWFGSVSVSENNFSAKGYQAELSGNGDGWQFDLLSTEYMDDYSTEGSLHSWNRRSSLRYILDKSWTVGFVGLDSETTSTSESYLLPSLWYSFEDIFSVSFFPNQQGSYRVDGSIYAFDDSNIRFNYENDFYRAEWEYNFSRSLDLYAESSYLEDFSVRYETGVRWFTGVESDGEFRAGVIGLSNGKYGFNIDWRTRILPGVTSSLRLEDEPVGSGRGNEDTGLALSWELSLDFGFAGGRIIPSSRQMGHSSVGSISGQLTVDGKPISKSAGINQISVLVDGYPRDIEVNGSYFILDNVRSGVVEVRLDGGSMPIQFSPDNAKFVVEVRRGSVTSMPLNLREEYSVAGRAVTVSGIRFIGQKVSVFNRLGERVDQVVTDRFGLYRINSLAPGDYQFVLEVIDDTGRKRKVSREVLVTNEFLFGQDIVVLDGAEEISSAESYKPEITVINDNFEAVDVAAVANTGIVDSAIATSYGPEFNVSSIPVDGCGTGNTAAFIQLASYTNLSKAQQKLAEYAIEDSFIDFYDRKETGMRQYRVAVGPFTESPQELSARAKRYQSITGASNWTRYRLCDDVRRHPPVNANQDLDNDEGAAEALVDAQIETIKIAPAAVNTPVVTDASADKVAHVDLKNCPSGDSASFIQLASYSSLGSAQKQLAKYSIDDSFVDFYDRKVGGTVKRQYRIAVGPFAESSQNLADRAKRYENITGAKSWTRTRACDDVRRHP